MTSIHAQSRKRWATPGLLRWARDDASYSLSEAAQALDISQDLLQAWESGDVQPTLSDLRRLSELYDVSLSYMFRKEPPREPRSVDYRGTKQIPKKELSRETHDGLREFKRLSRLARIVQQVLGLPTEADIPPPQDSEPETLAEAERHRLGVTSAQRQRWNSNTDAYQDWRKIIEDLGIFVFSVSMPTDECRGASIVDSSYATSVLTNRHDEPAGRLFTLLHEYGHILQRHQLELAICDRAPSDAESFSNRFAAALLVPERELRDTLARQGWAAFREWWADYQLGELAREFRVSLSVIAIRLETLELARSGMYAQKLAQWITRARGAGGWAPRTNKQNLAREKFGERLFGLAMRGIQSGVLTPVDLAVYAGRVRGGSRPWVVRPDDVSNWAQLTT